MTPEEALDLLPLLAADELDEATADSVRAALDGRAPDEVDVAAELEAWTELDGLLARTLAPPRAPLRRKRRPLLGFAASLLLLLPGSLGVGFLAQRELERTWWQGRGSLDALEDEAEARRILGALVAAQKLHRARAAAAPGRHHRAEYAPDVETLAPLLERDDAWRGARRDRFTIATAASLSRPTERFFAKVTRGPRGVFATEQGHVERLSPRLALEERAMLAGPIALGERKGSP